jgi:hypothetical protein
VGVGLLAQLGGTRHKVPGKSGASRGEQGEITSQCCGFEEGRSGDKQQPAAEPHRPWVAKARGTEGRKCDQAAAANGNAGTSEALLRRCVRRARSRELFSLGTEISIREGGLRFSSPAKRPTE